MELPTTSLTEEEVVMVLCWMTCCWEQAGTGLAGGLLSGPKKKEHKSHYVCRSLCLYYSNVKDKTYHEGCRPVNSMYSKIVRL